jgi:hypothetical protein
VSYHWNQHGCFEENGNEKNQRERRREIIQKKENIKVKKHREEGNNEMNHEKKENKEGECIIQQMALIHSVKCNASF